MSSRGKYQKEIVLGPEREVMAQVNTSLLLTLTLTCLVTISGAKHLFANSDSDPSNFQPNPDYYTEGDEEEKVEIKEMVEFKSRNKRFPIHLDPNFGSVFKFQAGECPKSGDGQTKFFCPSPHPKSGRFVCLEEWELCDGEKDCPDASDESASNCLFYKVMQSQLQSLMASQRERDDAERRAKTLENLRRSFP